MTLNVILKIKLIVLFALLSAPAFGFTSEPPGTSDTRLGNHPLPRECTVVFESRYEAIDQCPNSTPVFEVFDFWTKKSVGFACMCGSMPTEMP